jgi:hypothetical protein
MKRFVLGAAAAAALLAPAAANAETNAVIGLDYNSVDYDYLGDADTYGLSGAFNHDFSNGWQVQMDGRSGRLSSDGCCLAQNYAAIHYGTRTDGYSFAGFLGLQDFALYSGVDVGVEGQLHFANASIGGSLGYVDFGDVDISGADAHVDGMYFFTPNFDVNAGIGYTDADFGYGDGDWWTYNVGGEWRFDNSPASITLGYTQSDFDGASVDTWSIGVNFDLGTGTLQDRRVHGPSWGGAHSLYQDFNQYPPLII